MLLFGNVYNIDCDAKFKGRLARSLIRSYSPININLAYPSDILRVLCSFLGFFCQHSISIELFIRCMLFYDNALWPPCLYASMHEQGGDPY